MKRILIVSAFLAGIALISCQNQAEKEEIIEEADTICATADSATYLTAIEEYLVDSIGKSYAQAQVCIPSYSVIAADESDSCNILVWGDYWVFNYNISGDTLKTASGGSHPGLMHVAFADGKYTITGFDQVEDGSKNQESAKRIFGNNYEKFQSINSDEKAREQVRAEQLAKAVKDRGLKVSLYQDFG